MTLQSDISPTGKEVANSIINATTRMRRTKVMIALENQQILDFIIKGTAHEQIMKWIGLGEKNYWKRIAAIRKKDMELTKAEHTPFYTRGKKRNFII